MDESSFRQEVTAQGYGDPAVVEWAPGTVNEMHDHDFGATLLVISGDITVATEAGTTTCRAGERFALEAGVAHAETVGAEGVRFLIGRK
ncbi:MAG: cupin [Alphaproteobacteria bacterium]|jgi:quercetin dioxygenase-like cupin family protein|nr:cupin [Alphaproteobacteria bacterium]MDP6518156.1 cupin [Alphaproteobacteria bacterium]|tara:strand:+ start:394 stop:660 length:267 start_codon:yes stop_codon:yes gene_type:complete